MPEDERIESLASRALRQLGQAELIAEPVDRA